jgi:uncharacterized protein YdeI (YjbR/CyaY-like superfamily)
MPKRIPEIDAYIEKSADFAKPILKKIRQLFHKASPKITEEMKWSFPHFVCNGIVGNMAAFKNHASFGFWKASLMKEPNGLLQQIGNTEMGGCKITSVKDLPSDDVMIAYIQQAIELNEAGIKTPVKREKRDKKDLIVPTDLQAELRKNPKAAATFEAFSYSHRKEYIDWIKEAKRPETRAKRLATTIEQLEEGKSKEWKYQDC